MPPSTPLRSGGAGSFFRSMSHPRLAHAYGRAGASPKARLEQLLGVYDAAIEASGRCDGAELGRILAVLRQAVDPSTHPEIAATLWHILAQARRAGELGHFGEATQLLVGTRRVWQQLRPHL